MCGRFHIATEGAPEELVQLLLDVQQREQAKNPAFQLKRGEICPGDEAAVIAFNRSMKRSSFIMQWGFHAGKSLLINARSETAAIKPTFRESMALRRCLIPASAYYEWDHRPHKPMKLIFWPEDARMMYLAGIYRFEEGRKRPVFSILTSSAAEDIACFHDRMPVIIPPELIGAWLDHQQNPQEILQKALRNMMWKSV